MIQNINEVDRDIEWIAIPSNLFSEIELMGDDIFSSINQFDNQFDNEVTIVFRVKENYFIMEAYYAEMILDEINEIKEIIIIDFLEQIDLDEYLDNVLEGNEIIYNKTKKRILINFNEF